MQCKSFVLCVILSDEDMRRGLGALSARKFMSALLHRLERGFESPSYESQGHLSPPTVVASVPHGYDPSAKTDWHQSNDIYTLPTTVWLTVFPSQFKFDGNFVSLSSRFLYSALQKFVHGTTAVLSWHVQKFGAVWSPATELQLGEVSIEFELWAKNR